MLTSTGGMVCRWKMGIPKFMWKDGSKWLDDGRGFWASLIIYNTAEGIGTVEQKVGNSWCAPPPLTIHSFFLHSQELSSRIFDKLFPLRFHCHMVNPVLRCLETDDATRLCSGRSYPSSLILVTSGS